MKTILLVGITVTAMKNLLMLDRTRYNHGKISQVDWKSVKKHKKKTLTKKGNSKTPSGDTRVQSPVPLANENPRRLFSSSFFFTVCVCVCVSKLFSFPFFVEKKKLK